MIHYKKQFLNSNGRIKWKKAYARDTGAKWQNGRIKAFLTSESE